jgi:hypothetical protein
MKTLIAVLCGIFTISAALADPYVIAKQRARNTSAKNDQEQAEIARQAQATPGAANQAPADPALAATLKNISDLQIDIAGFNNFTGEKPEAAQKISLLNNLSMAAQGKKPVSASVQKLANHLIAATLGKKKMSALQPKLARDVHALFNGAHLNATQQQTLLDDVKKILTQAGATADETAAVEEDLKAIADETK